MILHLEAEGQTLEVKLPTGWSQLTMRQFIELQVMSLLEQVEFLTDLPPEKCKSLPLDTVAMVLEFLNHQPEYEGPEYPANIGAESIGKAELAKKVIIDTKDAGEWECLPFLYAIYMLPERIDFLLAFVQGFPMDLVEEVRDMPVSQVFVPAAYFAVEVASLVNKYNNAIYREPEPDQLAAGIDRFGKFGFYGSLAALGSPALMQEVLAMPAEVYYMQKVYEATQMDFEKAYREIVDSRSKVN